MSLLQTEVEQLSQALLKAEENEAVLREKNASLNQSLQELAAAHGSAQSRLTALQKALSMTEQEKQHLQVGGAQIKSA